MFMCVDAKKFALKSAVDFYGGPTKNANNSTNLNSIDKPPILQHSTGSNYPTPRSFEFSHHYGCLCSESPSKICPIWPIAIYKSWGCSYPSVTAKGVQ